MNEGNQSYALSTGSRNYYNSFKVTYTGTVACVKNYVNFFDKLNWLTPGAKKLHLCEISLEINWKYNKYEWLMCRYGQGA